MSHVMQGIPGVSVYVHDVTICSKTWKDHLHTLTQVFSRLKDSSLKVKFAKCVWAAAECRILGSVVSEHGIKPDPDNVEAIKWLPVPRNVTDLRSFLGAAGNFHEHLHNFAATMAPLRALLKKGVKFEWTEARHTAFESIKAHLVSSNCFRMPQLGLQINT
jgi:hypothetical protein